MRLRNVLAAGSASVMPDSSRKVAESAGFKYLNTLTDDDRTLKVRYERRSS